jgi:hypothetical protein
MIKRSKLIEELATILHDTEGFHTAGAKEVLELVEQYFDPKVRPLTDDEVEDHVLVKQVHHSRKDEVRNYVRSLEYEWKRDYLPEDKK